MTKSGLNKGFTKSSGSTYICTCCGKNTRDTGRGENSVPNTCYTCWNEGGFENEHSDYGHETFEAECPTCRKDSTNKGINEALDKITREAVIGSPRDRACPACNAPAGSSCKYPSGYHFSKGHSSR